MDGQMSNFMATPLDKFEQSFQTCLTAITKEDPLTNVDKDEIRVDVDQCLNSMVDCARVMEGYFLQKRLHIAAQKPELLIKDDANELRYEVVRKEELVKKNYEKISHWQSILADLQSTTTVSGKPALPLNAIGSPQSVGSPNPVGRPTSLGRSPTPGSMGGSQGGRLQSPMGSGLGFPSPGIMSPQQQQSRLEGPLAFLERTASTIGMNENR